MPTIKQVEAFYWSGQLGSFVAAAEALNTTQSNISKRIQELEYSLGIDVFDRSKRAIRLTAKGLELMRASEAMLKTYQRLREVGKSELAIEGPFRFGVTEAVALTWLPRFSARIRERFPGLVPFSVVDKSLNLNQKLLDRHVDLVIATGINLDPAFNVTPLVRAARVWVASPALVPGDGKLTAAALAALPILLHGENSLQRNLIGRYLKSIGVTPNIVMSCSSMSALARMVIDGVGVTYLHRDVFAADIRKGHMKVIESELEIEPIGYVAAYRNDVVGPVAAQVAAIAAEVCSFSDIRDNS